MNLDDRAAPIEIRMHGRGGQGTVTLAALLVDAAFRSGHHALGFPAFGTERTGAPVAASVRISDLPIVDRSAVTRPRIVIVQDPTLIGVVDVLDGIAPGALALVNSVAAHAFEGARTISVPATDLAREHLGVPITSTAMLGALAGATDLIAIDAVCAAIEDRFGAEVARRNVELARAAAGAVALKEVVS